MRRITSVADLEALRRKLQEKYRAEKLRIIVCGGTGCRSSKSMEVVEAFKKEIESLGLENKVDLKVSGCHGFCERGPIVVIYPEQIFYQRVKPKDVPEILERLTRGEVVDRLLYEDPNTGRKIKHVYEIPFYAKQKRIVLSKNGLIDPTSIEDYIAAGGYKALSKALQMKPEEIIEEIKKSGLRGRGGAGFPTGKKWEITRMQKSDVKYIICNCDEGDPGAYMDRSVLEGNPHSVIEGMIIGAYAIGANKGWIYVRHEYPLAVKHATLAVHQARELGLLGENILGSGFSFDIEIVKGAGAFVCGEETALLQSIEGKRPSPRQRPPYPAQQGLFGKPTCINNVKTWANVAYIIERGADWFSSIGTRTSKGTKVFSLVGKVKNSGLVEVPMGITLRELVYDIGGGAPDGKKVKAVQIGGPSGGCIPEELFDLPIDYESLTEAGSMMGSGGVIVMDENTCMVDTAKYFMKFLKDESCGKCVSCREGTQRMYEILSDITEGKASEEDLQLLEELANVVKDASLCGLGQTAPNPVLTTLRYFREEYLAHIREKRCPAGVCKALIKYTIDPEKCTGCDACRINCPVGAITGKPKEPHSIIQEKCIKCGICRDVCKFGAVILS